MRFQTRSRTTASAVITMIAENVSGELRAVSIAKNTSTSAVSAIAAKTTAASAPISARSRYAGDADEQEDDQGDGAADGRDRREIDEIGDDEHERRR